MANIDNIYEVSIDSVLEQGRNGDFLGNDLVLFTKFEEVPFPSQIMRMDCLFIALCTGGQATYTVEAKKHVVKQNDLIIITRGQVVSDYMLSPDCKGICIMASDLFYREIIKDVHELSSLFIFSRSQPVVHLSMEEACIFRNYFYSVQRRVVTGENPFLRQLCCCLLKACLYDFGKSIWKEQAEMARNTQTRAESIFTKFIQLVETHFRNQRKVAWYASQLNISPKYLSEIVKNTSHKSPNEWIEQYVTLEIRVLLKNSTLSIKEITDKMHFANQSFLGKYFKEHVGMSPSEYRKKSM